ncbi:MAG: DUF6036 family nucleotidyltransferase [Candidatus Njordarchaeia archaeon]
MHKNMVKILILVSKLGKAKTKEIAEKTGLSYAQTLNIFRELDRMGLVKLKRGEVESSTIIGDLLARLSEEYPLEEVLVGSTPVILSKILEPKKPREVSAQIGFTEKYVRKVLNKLSIRGVVRKEGNEYTLTDNAALRVLITQLARVLEGVEPEANVVYRDNYYIIKELPKGTKAFGTPTSYSAFPKYGLLIETNREVYIFPPKKVSLEEVIIHALLTARDKKERTLTALLYAKYYYEIDHPKLLFYAKWFDQTEKLTQLENYLNGTEEPDFLSWRDLEEFAKLYNVDISIFKERTFSEKLLEEIGEKLKMEIEAFLFGGAAMVLRGYKTSTKDIDIALPSEESLKIITKALKELGYEQKTRTGVIVYEHKKMSRLDIYIQKIGKLQITEAIKKRAQLMIYEKLKLLLLSDTDLLLTKLASARPRDLEDAKIIIRKGEIDWRDFINELEKQGGMGKHHYLTVLTALEEIEKQLKMHIPYKRKLVKMTIEYVVEKAYKEYGLKNPKDIKKLIDVSEETIRRVLKKLKKGKIEKST